jgi:hypothetical protein
VWIVAGTDKNVGGFHIAVNYSLTVDIGQCLRHTPSHDLRLVFSERRMKIRPVKILALYQLHDEVSPPAEVDGISADIENGHQIAVAQSRENRCFRALARFVVWLDRPGVEQLDCHITGEYFIPRPMYGGHATLAEERAQPVSAAEGTFEVRLKAGVVYSHLRCSMCRPGTLAVHL